MSFKEPIHDIAHLAITELFTPKFDESLWFFTDIIGMTITEQEDGVAYLRAYEDRYHHSLKLTAHPEAGVGTVCWRTTSPQALERRVEGCANGRAAAEADPEAEAEAEAAAEAEAEAEEISSTAAPFQEAAAIISEMNAEIANENSQVEVADTVEEEVAEEIVEEVSEDDAKLDNILSSLTAEDEDTAAEPHEMDPNLAADIAESAAAAEDDIEDETADLANDPLSRVRARMEDMPQAEEVEEHACPTCGSCSGMFTANSMNCLAEALGLALPGNGSLLATHMDRKKLYDRAANAIVDLAKRHYEQGDDTVLPRAIATKPAFMNAMAMDIAMGGSTNTILHLLALAHEAEVDFTMDDIDAMSKRVPFLCKVAPATADYFMEDVHKSGGVIGILGELERAGHIDTSSARAG